MALALVRPRSISPLGWVRVTLRILAMLVLLLSPKYNVYLQHLRPMHEVPHSQHL